MVRNRVLIILSCSVIEVFAQSGSWSATAPLGRARSEACAVRLADGRVLVSGGRAEEPLALTEIYTPDPASFQPAAELNTARSGHACVRMEDGRVLVAGGGADTLEIWEPDLDQWFAVQSTIRRAAGTTLTLLPSGGVLVVGGGSAALEIYDGFNSQLRLLPVSLNAARQGHTATPLTSGEVLIAGGTAEQRVLFSAEVFDPDTGEVRPAGALVNARTAHTATLLRDGRVLVAGGWNGEAELSSMEVYSLETEKFEAMGVSLVNARQGHIGVLLESDGSVVFAGGMAKGAALASTERFDATENRVAAAGALTAERTGIAAAMLEDGRLLAVGGRNAQGPSAACGTFQTVGSLEAVRFSQTAYPVGQRAVLIFDQSIRLISPGSLSFSLASVDLATGKTEAANARLLTTVAVLNANQALPSVPIVDTVRADAGKKFVLTLKGSFNLQTETVVLLPVTLRLSMPSASLEGQPVSVGYALTGDGQPVSWKGTLSAVGVGFYTVSLSGVLASISGSTTICCEPVGVTNFRGGFKGTAAALGEPSNQVAHRVVAKKPIVIRSVTPLRLQSKSTIRTTVEPNAGFVTLSTTPLPPLDASFRPNGSVNLLKNGVSLQTVALQAATTSVTTAQAAVEYTPTILDRRAGSLCFESRYDGDGRYVAASSAETVSSSGPACLLVAPAETTLVGARDFPTYNLGSPTGVDAVLRWPESVGMVGRSVRLLADGRVVGQFDFTRLSAGLASGRGSFTLPFNARELKFVYDASGDLDSSFSNIGITMNPVPVTLAFTAPTTTANPFSVSYRMTISTGAVKIPNGTFLGGTLELVDTTNNSAPIVVGQVTGLRTGSGITDGSSNTVTFTEVISGVINNVILPFGTRTLTLRFTGSAQFGAASTTRIVQVQ